MGSVGLPSRRSGNVPPVTREVPMRFLLISTAVIVFAASPIRIDVSAEKPGGEPKHFLPIVGDWFVAPADGHGVLMVDGRKWKNGQPAGGLVDKARAIYGSRHEEFI